MRRSKAAPGLSEGCMGQREVQLSMGQLACLWHLPGWSCCPFKNGLEKVSVSQLLGILMVSEGIVHRRSMVTALQCQPLWSHVCSVLWMSDMGDVFESLFKHPVWGSWDGSVVRDLVVTSEDLNLISRTELEGKKQLLQVVFWPPYPHHDPHLPRPPQQ